MTGSEICWVEEIIEVKAVSEIPEIAVGVSFRRPLKVLYYLPHDLSYTYRYDEPVLIETSYGGDVAWVRYPSVSISSLNLPPESLKRIIKPLSEDELNRYLSNWERARSYIPLIREKVREHNLPMHIIDARYTPDEKRFVIFFSAESRVDFRKLVVDLAKIFKMRIELYQIGARDGAAITGGIGVCGRPLCCYSFLREFKSISLSMIKEQGLEVNPDKLTGLCGRLKCCLAYELETYRELLKDFPDIGQFVIYRANEHLEAGKVISRNVSGRFIVVLSDDESTKEKVYLNDIVRVLSEEEYRQLDDELSPEEEGDGDLEGDSGTDESGESQSEEELGEDKELLDEDER